MYKHKNGIRVRLLEKEDLQILKSVRESNWTKTQTTMLLNSEQQEAWFCNMSNSHNQMVIVGHKENKSDITAVGLLRDIDWINRSCLFSGHIFPRYTKDPKTTIQSYQCAVDFIFEILNLNRISTEPVETNSNVHQMIFEEIGFKFEGRKKQAIYRCGRYYDAIMAGLLREEWETQQRIIEYNGSCFDNWSHELAGYQCTTTEKIIAQCCHMEEKEKKIHNTYPST